MSETQLCGLYPPSEETILQWFQNVQSSGAQRKGLEAFQRPIIPTKAFVTQVQEH